MIPVLDGVIFFGFIEEGPMLLCILGYTFIGSGFAGAIFTHTYDMKAFG